MSNKLYEENDIQNIANAIRNKNGTEDTYKVSQMSTAIDSIEVIEQQTAEGESLSLTNTKAMPYKDYVVKGKSEQDGEPSPSNPSEIHSVADDVNLWNGDATSLNNVTYSNGVVTQTQADTATNIIWKINFYNNSTYVKQILTTKNDTGIITFEINKDNTFDRIRLGLNGARIDSNMLINLSFLEDNKTYTLSFNVTNVTQGSISWQDIKIQEGTTATPYSPYNQGTVTIKQRGKNLLNVESIFALKGSKTIDLDLEAGSYTLSLSDWSTTGSNVMSQITFNYIDGTTLNVTIWASTRIYSLTFTKKVTSVKIFSNTTDGNSGAITTTYTNLMLEKGSQATDFEPYQTPYDYTIQTEPLRSLPNGVKNTIELQDMQNHTRIGRQTGTLTETTTITLSDAKTDGAYMCNIKEAGTLTGQTIELEAGDYEIIYELAEEVIEPLTQNQANTMLDIIKTGSYEGTTNIYTDEDVKPTIGVGYYKKG